MKKTIIITIIALFVLTLLAYNWQPSEKCYSNYKFIISTDGNAYPGQFQEILVQSFEAQGGVVQPLSPESTFSIQINGEFLNKVSRADKLGRRVMPMKHVSGCMTLGKILVPPETQAKTLEITVTPFGRTSPVLASASIKIAKELNFIALPNKTVLEAGETVDFSLAVFNGKALTGEFRQPVRAKIISPAGHLVANRVLLTNTEGLATFTTRLNRLAPAGDYHFEFSHLGNVQTYILPLANVSTTSGAFSLMNDSRGDLIREIQPTPNNREQAVVQYDCSSADYVFVEIWQNGNLLYGGQLHSDAGVAILPYTRKASPSLPILVAFTEIKKGVIHKETRKVLFSQSSNGKIEKLLTEGARQISPRNQLLFTKALFPTTMGLNTNLDLKIKEEKPVEFKVQTKCFRLLRAAAANLEQKAAVKRALAGAKNNRFFKVGEEMTLSRYSFKQLRLWQSAESFTELFLQLSQRYDYGFDELLEVGILLSRLGEGVPPELREKVLKSLEGQVNVIMDFWHKTQSNKALYSRYESRLAEAAFYLSQLVFVPKELSDLVEPHKIDLDRTLILPSFFGQGVSFDELVQSFVKGGKAVLLTNTQCINLNLITDNYSFDTQNLSKSKKDIINKLINLRSKPLIAELVFR